VQLLNTISFIFSRGGKEKSQVSQERQENEKEVTGHACNFFWAK
jgi:hypothetical protein